MQFGDILRNLLEEKDITQKQFAVALNMAPSTISSYVQNTRQPDFEILCRIASFFKVSTDYLLGYANEENTNHLENELLRVFRSLNTEEQKIYIEQGKAFHKI